MFVLLVGAAIRSLVLAAAVWLGLRVPALRYTRLQLTVWTTVLAAALFMPVGTEIASALLPSVPLAPIAIVMPLGSGGSTDHPKEVMVAAGQDRPSSSAAPVEDRHVAPMPGQLTEVARWPSGRTFASLIYAVVCGGLLARLALGLVLAARIARSATPLRDDWVRGHDVRLSPTIRAPATFGSVILLPHDCLGWSRTKRMVVVAHEAAHVERHHFHIQLAANLHCAIFWFSPLSWWLRRKLAYLAEASSDDAAIQALQDRSAYAAILLDMSGHPPELPISLAMARPATVRFRVRRILAGTESQVPAYAYRRAIMIGCVLPLVLIAAVPLTAKPSTAAPNDTTQRTPYRRIAIDPKLLDAYVGYYEDMQTGSLMIVTRDGDHLLTGRLSEPRYVEYPYTDHDFFLTELPSRNRFVTNSSGTAIRVIHRYDWIEEVLERISTETGLRRQAEYDRHLAEELLPHAAIKLNADILADYVGDYQISPTRILVITRKGTQLFAQAIGEPRFPVFPYTDRDFFYTSAAAQITFVKSTNDPATSLILHSDGTDRTGPRVSLETAEQMQRRWDDERRPHVRVSVDGAVLDRYVGRYGNDVSHVEITRDGNHLIAHVPDVPPSIIYPYTGHDFFAVRFPTQYSFIIGSNNRVERLVRHSDGVDKILWRID